MKACGRSMFFSLLCLVLTGCGGSSDSVSWQGTVTVGGQPLPRNLRMAIIQVRPMENVPGMSPVQADIVDGAFALKGVPKGKVWVSFVIEQKTGKIIKEEYGPEYEEVINIVPQKKRDGFEMEAVENDSAIVIDL